MRFALAAALFLTLSLYADPASPVQPAEPEAKPARVQLYGGVEIAKCLVEKYEKGAWIIWEGHRYWYLNNFIQKIVYLEGAPDAELTEWLRKANEARAKAEKSAAESDAERARKLAAEGAPSTGSATGGAGDKPAEGSGAGSAEGKKDKASKRDEGRSGDSSASGSSSSGNDRGPYRGNDGDKGRDPNRRNGLANVDRADDWRVLEINRPDYEMTLRNRLFKQMVRVHVEASPSFANIHRGDILHGNLGAGQSTLTSSSGVSITLTAESVSGPQKP